MKIAFVVPSASSANRKSYYDYKFYSTFLLSKKYICYPLSIPTLAGLTPPEHEIRVFDENLEAVDYDWGADLVGISVMTMYAPRAYRISEAFRKRGIRTVLGGIHPSMCTEEALQHCDSVVIGEAEYVWSALLRDAQQGQLKRTYKAEKLADLGHTPIAVRSVLSRKRYLSDAVQNGKGCPFNCEFCSVHAFDGQKTRHKTVDQILGEIKEIQALRSKYKKRKSIFFADDNIIADKQFARELFLALKPHNINWMCQASINISKEDDLLELMRDAGCTAVFIGFESISENNLARMHKGINRRYNYIDVIKKIQSYGILVHGSFVLGYDFDTEAAFDELIDFIRESNLLAPLINILTPFPGTKLFDRLEKEGRILHRDWDKYDAKHVVFLPSSMPPEELSKGYRRIIKQAYSFDAILEKLHYYWDIDFWKGSNLSDPVKFKYRLLFAIRLGTFLFSRNTERSRFILKILPRVFNKRVRISSILTLMAYNDFAYALQVPFSDIP